MSARDESPVPSGAGTLLLTGASGFIGGHLARRLAAAGMPLRCLVRERSDTSGLRALGVELVRGDLADAVSLEAAAKGAAGIVHCAALVSDWATVSEIRQANVLGTRALLCAAARAGVRRFVHVSTTDVHGHPRTPPTDPDQPPARFANWYAQTKLEAETEVRRLGREHGIEVVILRPATVYGPGSRELVLPIARALRAGQMLMVSGGRADAGLLYVENLLDAIELALVHPDATGASFDLCDGVGITWRSFLGDLAAGLGAGPPWLSLPYPVALGLAIALEQGYRTARAATGVTLPALLSRQAVQVLGRSQGHSAEAARDALGWRPRIPYEQGLQATVAWLAEQLAR